MGKSLFAALEELGESIEPVEDISFDEGESEFNPDNLAIENIIPETLNDFNIQGFIMEGLLSLEDLRIGLLEKETISLEDYNTYLVAYDQFKTTFGLERLPIDVALESHTDFRLALEAAGTEHKNILGKIFEHTKATLAGMAKGLAYLVSFGNSIESDVKKMKESIGSISGDKKGKVTLKVNRMLLFDDDKVVSNIGEYKAELKKSVEALITLMKRFDGFLTHNGIFNEIRVLISYISSKKYEKGFLNPYIKIYDELAGLVEMPDGKTIGDTHRSKLYLGEWATFIDNYPDYEEIAKKKDKDIKDEKEARVSLDEIRTLVTRVTFRIKYEPYENKDKEVTFDGVSKKDLQEILGSIEELNSVVKVYKRVGNKFRVFVDSFGKFQQIGLLAITPISLLGYLLGNVIFARVGLVRYVSMMVESNVGELLKIAKDTSKTASAVVSKSASEIK